MSRLARRAAALVSLVTVVVAVSACGGSHAASSDPAVPATTTAAVSSVTMVQRTFPGSLDPQVTASPQAAEATWVAYTGLVSYAHRNGSSGATLIPGLATALPQVSDGGRVYTVTLRRGLRFSNGVAVQASDFVYTLERALRLPTSDAVGSLESTVVGATAFADGARSISGVSANNRTGRIVIQLIAPDSGFDNVLASPALGILLPGGPLLEPAHVTEAVPAGSWPMSVARLRDVPRVTRPVLAQRVRDPPVGCGPYEIRDIDPRRGYTLAVDPHWRSLPGIPAGRVDIDVKVASDLAVGADAVVNNIADLLDWPTQMSTTLSSTIESQASGRFGQVDTGAVTNFIFFNTHLPPFSSRLARRAVAVGLDRSSLADATPGLLTPACELLPPAIVDRPANGFCPTGESDGGDLASARALVHHSGMNGQYVTVWTPLGGPQQTWMIGYAHFLDSIGFHAFVQPLGAAKYASIMGRPNPAVQTGFESASAAVPDPVALFRSLLGGDEAPGRPSRNFGRIDDARLNGDLARLGGALTTGQASSAWANVDNDAARGAHVVELGYSRYPFLVSSRIDYGALKINPIYGWDYTSVALIQ